jgi:hypothetical protein
LKECGLESIIDKCTVNEIDAELFWELTDEVLKDNLEIKLHGQRKQLLDRITEIKTEHE